MITIYKYPVPQGDSFSLDLPINAEVLCVQMQRNQPYIWIKLDTETQKIGRRFSIFGTGHDIGKKLGFSYIGTFQPNSDLVFHLFEEWGN